ncbi:MAG: hypothetical protein NXI14_09895 [bacterium]|nr:hypothetical protein [bacterium]
MTLAIVPASVLSIIRLRQYQQYLGIRELLQSQDRISQFHPFQISGELLGPWYGDTLQLAARLHPDAYVEGHRFLFVERNGFTNWYDGKSDAVYLANTRREFEGWYFWYDGNDESVITSVVFRGNEIVLKRRIGTNVQENIIEWPVDEEVPPSGTF